MAREPVPLVSFNRGIVSRLGLARVDVKRISLAAQTQQNWLPRVLGSMMLRPGRAYIDNTANNAATRLLKFIFATSDTALIELTDSSLRVLIADVPLTRPSVTTAVVNGDFTTNLASWTDNDEAGAASTWVAPGYMQLVGTGSSRAIRDQQVTVAGANIGVEHALRIEIARGPVFVRVGTAVGLEDYVSEALLETGTHSLSFTPSADFHIRFFSSLERVVWVNSCNVEAAGEVTLPTPWVAGDLSSVRIEQSADVLFVACAGVQQRKIERRAARPNARSWSIVLYRPPDGPFKIANTTPVTLTASALTGNITITASQPLFNADHVGALFAITSVGQQVITTSAVTGTATSSIRITGVGTARNFNFILTGIASGSQVDLQRSYDDVSWADLGAPYQWTADITGSIGDLLDNQIVYYRLRLTNRVAPDSVTMQLTYGGGSVRGVARVTGVTSSVLVDAEVLSDMGGTTASEIWQEGQWSDAVGWPTAVRIHEGRIWWAGQNTVWASVSDQFDSFDETVEGDSGTINRTIGAGPVDNINWILAAQRIILGADGAEQSIRSSSFDEPITPTTFHLKSPSTQGSGNVDAVQVDQSGFFVNRSGKRLFELSFDIKNYDYVSDDATKLVPDLADAGIVRIDVQRQPETRVHCVLADGTVALLLFDKIEDTKCWVTITTDGDIEDVCVLPALDGDTDDQVYYVVKRTINGSTVRFIEKWAQEADCLGDQQLCMLADAYVSYTGAATTSITGLSHLEGEEVVVWADGADVGTDDTTDPAVWTQRYTVSGGAITLSTAASNVVVGLGYEARFKSAKIGQALSLHKTIDHLGLVMANVHRKGLRFGRDFDYLDNLPEIEEGAEVTQEMRTDYDEDPVVFPGTWSTDERLCLLAVAPRPVTVLAAIPEMEISQ